MRRWVVGKVDTIDIDRSSFIVFDSQCNHGKQQVDKAVTRLICRVLLLGDILGNPKDYPASRNFWFWSKNMVIILILIPIPIPIPISLSLCMIPFLSRKKLFHIHQTWNWLYAMQVYYVFVQIKSVSILMLPSFWLSLLDTSQWLDHVHFLIVVVLPCSCFEASAYWMPWFVPFVLHPWLLVVSLLQVSTYMIND